ncbi:hypothetical protein OS493_016893 [Desmophyllum pertusum]|uniref:Uncharacterized protein n=1 Tax=Desmophyllum pertusum TaxID=174260 RepID=A0A9X0CK04_9CNID|nr:hypothetical protein OS493_016893 [Desmophyllum pertusum]
MKHLFVIFFESWQGSGAKLNTIKSEVPKAHSFGVPKLARTINLIVGRKLGGMSKEDIMKAVLSAFPGLCIVAVQIGFEVVRVSFASNEDFTKARSMNGIKIKQAWCKIQGGGPPITMLHLFDFPHEGLELSVEQVMRGFGEVVKVKKQT